MSEPPIEVDILPVELYPDEQAVRFQRATHLRSTRARIGFNPVNGICWLTDRRLIFKGYYSDLLGGAETIVDYPLSHLTAANVLTERVELLRYRLIRMDFDDGGREYFEFQGNKEGTGSPEDWRKSIERARAVALALPYQTPPTQRASIEGAGWRVWRFLGLLIAGIIVACVVISLILAVGDSLLNSRP